MKIATAFVIPSFAFAFFNMAFAGPRTSPAYTIPTDATDSGGVRTASTNYSNAGSVGLIAGLATVAVPVEFAKSGYLGQLYEVTGLVVTASPATINETSTRQLAARQLLDDASILAVPAGSVAWSVQSGPLTAINPSGLATAGAVYQTTAAVAQGSYLGRTGSLTLSVLDVLPDNFGSYAGDGIDDSWQNQYFGLNNPKAAANFDASGTGQTNLFKFTAGLNPLDPTSRFTLTITPVSGQSGQKNLLLTPVVAGRTYLVQSSTLLTTWGAQTVSNPVDAGAQRTVTDTAASGTAKFYRVLISKP